MYLSSLEKSKKAPGQLLMHIADEEVERTRMKTAINDNMPHYDPKRRCKANSLLLCSGFTRCVECTIAE